MASTQASSPHDLDSDVDSAVDSTVNSDMDSAVDSAVQGGDWTSLEQLMASDQLTDQQKARVVVGVMKYGNVQQFSRYVRPFCSRTVFDLAMTELTSAGLWPAVLSLSECVGHQHLEWQLGEVSVNNSLLAIVAKGRWKELGAVLHGDTDVSAAQKRWALLRDVYCVLKELVARVLWWAVVSLFFQRRAITETQRVWAITKAANEATIWELSDFILPHCTEHHLDSVSRWLLKQQLWSAFGQLWWAVSIRWRENAHKFSECISSLCGNTDVDLFMSHLFDVGDWKSAEKMLLIVGTQKRQWQVGAVQIPGEWIKLAAKGQWHTLIDDTCRSQSLSVVPWVIIRQADLSCVGEQLRRWLFSSAVKQKQWSLVKQWADHTLYDDQRRWALRKAYKEKQWDVYLHLAEHGLTEEEVTRVHYLVALNADWGVVLDMCNHETDVVEVRQLLSKAKFHMVEVSEEQERERKRRVCELGKLEAKLESRMVSLETLESAVEQGDWQVVLFTIRQRRTADDMSMTLKAAVARKSWDVVMQLLRLGIHTLDQQPVLLDMIRHQQWGVCGVMVERGLDPELYMDAIPQLMEMNQCGLVGQMMDYEVDDAVRRQVMQSALQRKEGSVVSQCIKGMKQQLSLQGREDVFHTAVTNDTLQAVMPLVEEKDDAGLQHRDIALQLAISQQQWDIVDHCLHHGADINTPDDQGNSPIHRAAQSGDWEMVLALAKRGGDPSLLDSAGLSVLHKAIQEKNWKFVKSLVIFGSDLQQSARHSNETRTVLEMLIEKQQEDIVGHALSHGVDQWKGVNGNGETTLHTMCFFYRLENICSLLPHGVDPLSVTHHGHSALSYAVLCLRYPQMMVAKCISLGFSTHQPHITNAMQKAHESFLSPIQLAVMLGLPEVTRMLYESGSCSSRELFQVLPSLLPFTKRQTVRTYFRMCSLVERIQHVYYQTSTGRYHYSPSIDQSYGNLIQKAVLYLAEVSSTPRSLKSMCRLVISSCLTISVTREADISQLPIPRALKNYVSFSDLLEQSWDSRKTWRVLPLLIEEDLDNP